MKEYATRQFTATYKGDPIKVSRIAEHDTHLDLFIDGGLSSSDISDYRVDYKGAELINDLEIIKIGETAIAIRLI